jgi:hypothetical protein
MKISTPMRIRVTTPWKKTRLAWGIAAICSAVSLLVSTATASRTAPSAAPAGMPDEGTHAEGATASVRRVSGPRDAGVCGTPGASILVGPAGRTGRVFSMSIIGCEPTTFSNPVPPVAPTRALGAFGRLTFG